MEELPKNTSPTPNLSAKNEDKKYNQDSEVKIEITLPKSTKYPGTLYMYQGFWCRPFYLPKIIALQNHFEAQDTDVIIVTKPKSGTTWLKSLVFSILNRTKFTRSNHPLLTKNPHELMPFLELNMYSNNLTPNKFNSMVSPRLFATHIPYNSLPRSIKESKCKVVYMARNIFDTFVSSWKFETRIFSESFQDTTMEDYVETFCNGEEAFGPHWVHVLGYWKESLEKPNKVLFIKYEDLKENGILEMKKLGEFLGCGFSLDEERKGVVEEILELCSFNNLKEMEVNKTGKFVPKFGNNEFFRKGEVGDWVNHLSPIMVEKLDKVKEKLIGHGLEFKF